MMDNSHSINREGPEDARTTSRKLTYFKYHNIITCTWGKGNICWKKTMKYEHNQFSCFLWGTLEGKRGIFAFFILPQFYAHPPAGILTYLSTNSWYLHVGFTKKHFWGFLWCSDRWDEKGPGGGIWIIYSQNIPKPQLTFLACRCVCVWLNPLHLHNSRCSV